MASRNPATPKIVNIYARNDSDLMTSLSQASQKMAHVDLVPRNARFEVGGSRDVKGNSHGSPFSEGRRSDGTDLVSALSGRS